MFTVEMYVGHLNNTWSLETFTFDEISHESEGWETSLEEHLEKLAKEALERYLEKNDIAVAFYGVYSINEEESEEESEEDEE